MALSTPEQKKDYITYLL